MESIAAVMMLLSAALAADETPVISPAVDEQGILVHEVRSPFQNGTTRIKVLLPDARQPRANYPAIYILPVEAQSEARYGDGLAEVKKHGLHNKHQAIFIAPTFSHLPWYADHPTETAIRQESYFLRVVVPFVERSYPVEANIESRLLLGFSKSGWGAWGLLLRHPDLFGRAAAWDAPLMMDRLGKYGTAAIFGTQDNFETYRISDLLRAKPATLAPTSRLILLGYNNFRHEHEKAHALLNELNIPHDYRDGPERPHNWHSGWVSEAVELLINKPTSR
jgi:hypothetical protein